MIAFDRGEELGTQAFQLIGADRGADRIPGPIEIGAEEGVGEVPHRKIGMIDMMPQPDSIAHGDDGGNEAMAAAAQGRELRTRLGTVCGLVEPSPVAFEHLVSADDQRTAVTARYLERFKLGQGLRSPRCGSAITAEAALDLVLVDAGGIGDARNTGMGKEA